MSQQRIDRFLKLMTDRGASDLHLAVGRSPALRLDGAIDPIRFRALTDADYDEMMGAIAPDDVWARFKETGDADFAYELSGVSRFRVNLFKQQRGQAAVFRVIPTKLMTLEQLGMPPALSKVTSMTGGLFLVTGPTGSGKSTTLSAIINEMNMAQSRHFITIEDPIEFVHPNKRSLMSQREIGDHAQSFSSALQAAIREDPDVILVGEMRDLETIGLALTAAEMGVLVFGTLHTNSAAKTIDRILNVFPSEEQEGARISLASVLKGVLAQQLLKRKGGGRVAAIEVLFSSPAMASLIREGKTHQLPGLISMGKADGMRSMDDALKGLVVEDKVDPLQALDKALDKDTFKKWLVTERGLAV